MVVSNTVNTSTKTHICHWVLTILSGFVIIWQEVTCSPAKHLEIHPSGDYQVNWGLRLCACCCAKRWRRWRVSMWIFGVEFFSRSLYYLIRTRYDIPVASHFRRNFTSLGRRAAITCPVVQKRGVAQNQKWYAKYCAWKRKEVQWDAVLYPYLSDAELGDQ